MESPCPTPTSKNVSTRAPTPSLPRRYPSSRSLYHSLQPWEVFEPDAQSIPVSMGFHTWRQAPRPACPTRAGGHWSPSVVTEPLSGNLGNLLHVH